MHWAQGTQPDPFQLLQLHPSAPTSLVTAAYQALAGRGDSSSGSSLDVAYRNAMAHRVAGDPPSALDLCHYAALCVDPTADADIIALAYQTLERELPLRRHSLAHYQRQEAYRVLSNPVLRARYDDARLPATMAPTTALWPPARALTLRATPGSLPRKDGPVAIEKKRGLFGLRRSREPEVDPVDARIRELRAQLPLAPDEAPPEPVEERLAVASPVAEITFTAGPRAGMRVELESNVVPLGEGKSAATIWRHGERFLMRHNGKKVLVSGHQPVLAIVVLEDGDEVVVGGDRASFRLLPSSG